MDSILIIAVRSGTGVLYLSMDYIVIIAVRSGTGLSKYFYCYHSVRSDTGYCMSQYGLYCYHSCQVWHWSIVCLSTDSIVIIAVRAGTGVLYVSVWIILLS